MKMGNAELIDQIKLRIRDTYMDQLKRNKEDTLVFFIRENKVQKVFPEKAVYYQRGVEQKMLEQGMNRKQMRNFESMVEMALKHNDWDLYYCTLNINYEVFGEEEDDYGFKISVRDERHFSWK